MPETEKTSTTTTITSEKEEVVEQVRALDWKQISQDLDTHGNAIIKSIITSTDCNALAKLYNTKENIFRGRVVMEQHNHNHNHFIKKFFL
jgi:hypothetical protein